MRQIQFIPLSVAILALIVCEGCASLGSVKEGFSKLGIRKSDQRPWERKSDLDEFDSFGERNPARLISQDLAPRNLGTTLKISSRLGTNQQKADVKFNEAKQLYDKALAARDGGNNAPDLFNDAANRFREAAALWPNSTMEHDSLFMQGESYFFADEYVSANRAFEVLLARYSGTRFLDQVESRRFSIAQYWLAKADQPSKWTAGINFSDKRLPTRGLAGGARRILHRIRLDDPTGKLADDATIALGDAFFKAQRYVEAAEAYADLRTSYPGSPHQFRAHLFELKSRMQTYQGNSYDGEPLIVADKLIRNMLRLFPKECGEHEQYLASEATAVRNMLADRDMSLGQYYEEKGENRAASYYYAQVVENFSDTELAQQANERVVALTGKPAAPSQKAEWLVNIFPSSEKAKPLIASGDSDTVLR